ncbi:MAG TPA: acyl-CoA dehydrogenase family protein [Dehalococcoidia bacterium]|nr:acyl-CoA dehydrogenase family protein [Dehalococcoidia bacterium]
MNSANYGLKSQLEQVEVLLSAAEGLFQRILETAQSCTDKGRRLDDFQVLTERVAYQATELRAAAEIHSYARRAERAGVSEPLVAPMALAYAAELSHRIEGSLEGELAVLELQSAPAAAGFGNASFRAALRAGLAVETLMEIGRGVIASRGANNGWIEDEAVAMARDSVRAFARAEVAPLAERIHRNDELVPDTLIAKMAELGFFAASIPEEFGGSGLGYPVMAVTTEELSFASLAGAGSLSTRPEILTRALLAGGTQEQRRKWLPRIASGELMVAIAVTEPDAGSDVAALITRAEPVERDGQHGYLINGTKAWSTFAGRAEVIALLARTSTDPSAGARGLSMFIVTKQAHRDHDFEERQAGGGSLAGRAIATPGYRGMHSYILSFDNWFVPAENLVGGDAGLNRGFYLQMAGFAAGRLQTGGRAIGLAQAGLVKTAEYVRERRQFGRPLAGYQLTQHKLGRMATHITAARQLTYAAAEEMEAAERGGAGAPSARLADLGAAMSKLLASDVAVWTTQEGQLLHGGWGYAEETPISRYVVDAQVLPIFEGAKQILELRVIAAALLRGALT